jgi:hypothetical protein
LGRIAIKFEGKEMISLTDMWKASGGNPDKRPNDWKVISDNQEFIMAISKKLNTVHNGIMGKSNTSPEAVLKSKYGDSPYLM